MTLLLKIEALKNNDVIPYSEKKDAFNRIKQFMTEGDITLLAKEEEILKRWIYADKLLKQRKYTQEQIIEKVSDMFSVSEFTARNDISYAMALFSATITVNKKYLLHHHAENLQLMIEQFSKDKSLVHLVPKLAAEYTRALDAIPDEIKKETPPPPRIVFNIIGGQQNTPRTYEEALKSIEKRSSKEYTDFEEIPPNE